VNASTHAVAFKAHHLALTGLPATLTAGVVYNLTVTVRDASNAVVTGYTDTIAFTNTDSQSMLPASYTFQSADHGRHTFHKAIILNTPGTQTVSAADTAAASITGKVQVTVQSAASISESLALALDAAAVDEAFNGDRHRLWIR
jgi:hypothetical protein